MYLKRTIRRMSTRLVKIVCVQSRATTNSRFSRAFGGYIYESLSENLYWCVVEESVQTLYKLCQSHVICRQSRRTNNFRSCTVMTSNLQTRTATRRFKSNLWSYLGNGRRSVKYLHRKRTLGVFSRLKQKCTMGKSRQYRPGH